MNSIQSWLRKGVFSGLCLLAIPIVGMGCGSGSSNSTQDTSLTLNSLTAIPDTSEMLTGSASTSLSRQSFSNAIRAYAVSGTPPTLGSIGESNVDQYFWNGLLAQILDGLPITSDVINNFWAGENSCRMAQNPMQAFTYLQQSGTVLCYMKNVPQATSGVTITGAEASSLFDQAESTKVVRVQLNNFQSGEDGESGSGSVYFTIYGRNTSEGNPGYAFDMHMCDPTASEYQATRVNRSTGAFTYISYNNESESNQSQTQISAVLRELNGNIVFDTDAERSLQVVYQWAMDDSEGSGKNLISVSGDQISNLSIGAHESSFGSLLSQINTLSQFGGSSLADVSFIQAGMAGRFSSNDFSHTFYTGVEFQDGYYVPVTEGAYYGAINNYDFDNSFYDGISFDSSLASQLSGFDCNQSADAEVTIDFSDPALAQISSDCEIDFSETEFCNGGSVEQARQLIMSAQP